MGSHERASLSAPRADDQTPALTVEHAERLFGVLASAIGIDAPQGRHDCESLVNQMLFMLEAHGRNELRFADEIRRWRNEIPLNFTDQFCTFRDLVENQPKNLQAINESLVALREHFSLIYAENQSILKPSRYQITFFENGVPQPDNPLRIIQIREGDSGAINLHINLRTSD